MAKDVLDILRDHYLERGGSEDVIEATAKIAELIAADVEYDEAWDLYDECEPEEALVAFDRASAATVRRAAALAACRGMA